jgi:hypothetical protein
MIEQRDMAHLRKERVPLGKRRGQRFPALRMMPLTACAGCAPRRGRDIDDRRVVA